MFMRLTKTDKALVAHSVIAPEMKVKGDVITSGGLSIGGHVDGNVRCARLDQVESGRVSGDILADEAKVAGLVEGRIDARAIVVQASARITGDVTYETISMEAGARIDGRLARRAALAPDAAKQDVLIATPTHTGEEEEEAQAEEEIQEGLLPLEPRKRMRSGRR